MKCESCGASNSSAICKYCGCRLLKVDQAPELLKRTEQIDELRARIEYFKRSGAPEDIKQKKISALTLQLRELEGQ